MPTGLSSLTLLALNGYILPNGVWFGGILILLWYTISLCGARCTCTSQLEDLGKAVLLHSNFQGVIITPKMQLTFQVQDNPFFGVTLTPKLTPNLGSFLLLKKSSFYSHSGVKITPKMGLFLLLAWVVFTLFGVNSTLEVE